MNRILLAKTGWGKSFYGQAIMEANAPEYDMFAVLDYKDEYRGLVKSGYARHMIVGPNEADLTVTGWKRVLKANPRLILARYSLDEEEWQQVADRVAGAMRDLARTSTHDGFLAIDEAHFVAPNGTVPDALKGVATTGRGEGVSSLWLSQRPAEVNETILAQCGERLVGAFSSDRDLKKIDPITEYPVDVHKAGGGEVRGLPEDLCADGDPLALRRFEQDGSTVGSEWIYSNDRGDLERRDTRTVEMDSTHYGPEGRSIADP